MDQSRRSCGSHGASTSATMVHRGGVAVGRKEGDGGSSSGKTSSSSARPRAVVPLSEEEEKEEREREEDLLSLKKYPIDSVYCLTLQ